jgi:hypothetical protein
VTALTDWENFYVIVGSSAGALTGLQFVVMALIADMPAIPGAEETNDAFSTPTIVHFCAVLLLSGLVSAPWSSMTGPAIAWGLEGFAGLVYEIIVARRMVRQPAYRPVFEDWLFHIILPVASYATLVITALLAQSHAALFVVGAAALLLLFAGIHNAWDAVTYLVFVRRRESSEGANRPS